MTARNTASPLTADPAATVAVRRRLEADVARVEADVVRVEDDGVLVVSAVVAEDVDPDMDTVRGAEVVSESVEELEGVGLATELDDTVSRELLTRSVVAEGTEEAEEVERAEEVKGGVGEGGGGELDGGVTSVVVDCPEVEGSGSKNEEKKPASPPSSLSLPPAAAAAPVRASNGEASAVSLCVIVAARPIDMGFTTDCRAGRAGLVFGTRWATNTETGEDALTARASLLASSMALVPQTALLTP